jgi:hypothetical protein
VKGKKKKKGGAGDDSVNNVETEASTEDSVESAAVEETVEVTVEGNPIDESPEAEESVSDDGTVPELSEAVTSSEADAAAPSPDAEADAPSPDADVAAPSTETEEAAVIEAAPEASDPSPEAVEAGPSEEEAAAETEPAIDSESERRQAGRKGVKLNRLISSKVIDGNSHRECYLHLVDISEGGIRVNSDDPFPDDRDFALEIGLAAFGTEIATRKPRINFPVRMVWTKSLVGGMVVSGLAFKDLDQESQEIVAAIMQGASPQGRRQHFRLNRVLGVELGGAEDSRWLYPLTLDLSVEGMRICLSETLEVGAKFPIRIFLEFELPTVEATSEVMWQEVMPSGRVQVGLKFDGMSERDALAIKTYIDQCLEQDQAHRNH